VNRYRVLLPLTVHTEDGAYVQGEEFDKEFESAEDEAENLRSGLIEIVPREYRVIGTSEVLGHVAQDGPFSAAIPKGQEELLLGYHIERVEESKPKAKAKADKG
jgi:hypothetical protein